MLLFGYHVCGCDLLLAGDHVDSDEQWNLSETSPMRENNPFLQTTSKSHSY